MRIVALLFLPLLLGAGDADPDATLRGRVLGGAGEPLEQIRISLHRADTDCFTAIRFGETGADGGFAFEGLRDGDYIVQASRYVDDGDQWTYSVRARFEAKRSPELVIRPIDQRITGRVVDPRGQPLADAFLFARLLPGRVAPGGTRDSMVQLHMNRSQLAFAHSGQDGSFVLDELIAGRFTIRVGQEGFEEKVVEAETGGQGLRIVLDAEDKTGDGGMPAP